MVNKWLEPKRFYYALIGFSVACVISYYGPRVYLQYVDATDYVHVESPINFDRKIYSAGETQTAKMIMTITINSDILLKSRLMLILMDNQFRPIKETQVEAFVIAKQEPQTFIIPSIIPCDLADGKYLYRGEIKYVVKGVQKISPFESDIFTIDNSRASDSAQIAQNCPKN